MEQKKEITYNFNELYYIFLISRLERINVYLISDKNYMFALEEFKHWFIELSYEIKENIPPLYKTLTESLEEGEFLINEYDKTKNNRSIHRKIKEPMLSEIELKLKYKMNTIYILMMEAIDRLNMFLRKENSTGHLKAIYS